MLVTATGGTGTGPSSTLRATSSEAPVSVSDPKRKIEFTVYPNPNRGVFTVDFSGIENNHEVEILLCNIENGQIVYKTTFLSQSVEHNKVDVVPANAVEPGRYICALVCEGIRLNTTVVIH